MNRDKRASGNALDGHAGSRSFSLRNAAMRPFHVRPTGILRQNRSDNHFKTRASRPPVLWSIAPEITHHNKCSVPAEVVGSGELASRAQVRRAAIAMKRAESAKCGWQTSLSQDSDALAASQEIDTGLARQTCSGVQVLANSQRWFKIERRNLGPFAMLSVGCTVFRESYGCLSVWVKSY